jgi:hypothetical protein
MREPSYNDQPQNHEMDNNPKIKFAEDNSLNQFDDEVLQQEDEAEILHKRIIGKHKQSFDDIPFDIIPKNQTKINMRNSDSNEDDCIVLTR